MKKRQIEVCDYILKQLYIYLNIAEEVQMIKQNVSAANVKQKMQFDDGNA